MGTTCIHSAKRYSSARPHFPSPNSKAAFKLLIVFKLLYHLKSTSMPHCFSREQNPLLLLPPYTVESSHSQRQPPLPTHTPTPTPHHQNKSYQIASDSERGAILLIKYVQRKCGAGVGSATQLRPQQNQGQGSALAKQNNHPSSATLQILTQLQPQHTTPLGQARGPGVPSWRCGCGCT